MPVPVSTLRHAVGLYRVSTAEQGQSGLGLEAQRTAVRAFAAAQGWTLVAEFSDVASGKDDRRPGFRAALARCRQLGAVLVAARLDRITRRAHTLSQLLEEGYAIRAADMPGADDLMVRIYAAMAQKERELIGERTRAALAAAKARGRALGGDRGYRPAAPARTRPPQAWRAGRRRSGRRTGWRWRWSGCGRMAWSPTRRWRGHSPRAPFRRRAAGASGRTPRWRGCCCGRAAASAVRPRRRSPRAPAASPL